MEHAALFALVLVTSTLITLAIAYLWVWAEAKGFHVWLDRYAEVYGDQILHHREQYRRAFAKRNYYACKKMIPIIIADTKMPTRNRRI